jgi:hypothetical protein
MKLKKSANLRLALKLVEMMDKEKTNLYAPPDEHLDKQFGIFKSNLAARLMTNLDLLEELRNENKATDDEVDVVKKQLLKLTKSRCSDYLQREIFLLKKQTKRTKS